MGNEDDTTGTEKVLFEVEDHLARVTINRPEKLNAMDPETYQGLSRAWERIRDDDEIWVGLVTGAGDRAFSAGADLETAIQPGDPDWSEFWKTQESMLLNRGMEVWKPIVAAVNGYCLAGGMTLLLATDIRIAGEGAQFGLSEVKRGILPANGGTQRISRQLPHTAAMELLLTGDRIDATRARELELVNRVVDPGRVRETAEDFAERILDNAPLAVQAIKELSVRGRSMPLNEAIRMESSFFEHLLQTRDAQEGTAAFAEDRDPEYRGE